MRRSSVIGSILTVIVLVALSACSKPEAELGVAQKAQAQAKEQKASEFATGEWNSAQQAMSEAEALLAKQSYGEARTLLLRAKSRYEKARDIAKSRREQLLKEVKLQQKTIDLRYTTLKSAIQGSKISPAKKKSLDDACADIDKGVEKIKLDLEQGMYTEARTSAMETMRQIYDAERELNPSPGKKKT